MKYISEIPTGNSALKGRVSTVVNDDIVLAVPEKTVPNSAKLF